MCHKHWTEEFLFKQWMVGCFGDINGGVNEKAFAPVLGASNHLLKLTVFVGGVDRPGDLIESRLINHGPKEALKVIGVLRAGYFASCICRSCSEDNTGILGILVSLDAVSDCFFFWHDTW